MDIEDIVFQLRQMKDLQYSNFIVIPKIEIDTTRDILSAFECCTTINNRDITLQIGFNSQFPHVLPRVFLKEKYVFPRMVPHVEEDGYICYLSSEGLLINFEKPVEIVAEALQMAHKVLEDNINGGNMDELYNEFEAFWRRIGDEKYVVSLVKPHTERGYKGFYAWTFEGKLSYQKVLFCEDKKQGQAYAKQVFGVELSDEDVHEGYFLMLRPKTYIDLDKLKRSFTPKAIRTIIKDNLSGSIRRRFFNRIKTETIRQGKNEYLLLAIPQPDGNLSLVGVEFSDFRPCFLNKSHPVAHPLSKIKNHLMKIAPLAIERHYQEHLVARTGGDVDVISKKVIVLGAGAVGSRIVGELVHAGVNEVTVIDKDVMSPDNLYRHEVGAIYLNKNKAQAVANHVKFKYPLSNIEYKKTDVYDLLMTYPDMFEKYDLIIVALGNPTIEMLLNRKLRELEKAPPCIFTWVEPLGIGGHAIATLNNNPEGCYECLHTDPLEPTIEYINRASFAAPRQKFSKTVAGCGTQFTPYGSLDALQTAIIATRLAINILAKKEADNPLLSWKGDAEKFINVGFVLSARYELPQEFLFENRYQYKTDRCPTCYREKLK